MAKAIILATVVAGIAAAGAGSAASGAGRACTLRTYPELEPVHVPLGTRVHYNSFPPTSGPHYKGPERIPKEFLEPGL